MTVAMPLAFVLLLPLGVALMGWRRRGRGSALPGQWAQVVDPRLRAYLGRGLARRRSVEQALALVVALILILALARPAIELAPPLEAGNLAGRVVILDMSGRAGVAHQRVVTDRLLEASPGVPTALVAVAADTFDVVPLTTDRQYLRRYLQVIDPAMMPLEGRALGLGLARANAILDEAGIVAGQIVVVSNGSAPETPLEARQPDRPHVLIVPDRAMPAWATYAEASKASLVGASDVMQIVDDLGAAVLRQQWTRSTAGRLDLVPWLTGLALVLWLGLFRRRLVA